MPTPPRTSLTDVVLGERGERIEQRPLVLLTAGEQTFALEQIAMLASAAAQHVACPAYVAPWRKIGPPASPQNGSAISLGDDRRRRAADSRS